MPDQKDYTIELLRQQREEALNRLVAIAADANVKIAELEARIKELQPDDIPGC